MLHNFFEPKSVAIIGASRKVGKVGHDILKNILQYGFKGKVYPINPSAKTILGQKAYPSVVNVEGKIDLAVVTIPFHLVLSAIEECGKKKISSVIIISAGFKEAGSEGAKIELQLGKRARELGIRVIGPNCLGVIDTFSCLNASFAKGMPSKGNIAFFSQSGALCTAILDWALAEGVGFSKFISFGNKVDVNEIDLMQHLSTDPATKVILGYLESVEDGKKFMEAAWNLTKKKPLIITKSGGSPSGSRAASSHTGSIVGSEVAYRTAFKQSGIIRANSVRELFDFAMTFSYQPPPHKSSLAIITNAGGPGIIAADACEEQGVELSRLKQSTIEELRKCLPPGAAFYNPVDVIGDATAERYRKSGKIVIEDPEVGGVLFLLTPQAMTDIEEIARSIVQLSSSVKKPIFTSFMGKKRVAKGIKILLENKIPNYSYPEDGIKSFKTIYQYYDWLKQPKPSFRKIEVDKKKLNDMLSNVKNEGRFNLAESEARELVSAYGFTLPRTALAETSKDAIAVAEKIGYPVVMKIASPDILHKSDIGGIAVGLQNGSQVEESFQEIISNAKRYMPNAVIWGVSIQEQVVNKKEIILGMSRDSQFGPLIMFGLGGIYTEVMKDVSFRIAPVDVDQANQMIKEIRSYPILKGIRGEQPADIDGIVDSILRLSQMVIDFPEIMELDINPLCVKTKGEGTVAIDVRIILTKGGQI